MSGNWRRVSDLFEKLSTEAPGELLKEHLRFKRVVKLTVEGS